jgi:hypothetical protein
MPYSDDLPFSGESMTVYSIELPLKPKEKARLNVFHSCPRPFGFVS